MIRDTDDLLAYYGEGSKGDSALDERTLSRRIYKNTACGAWAVLIPPGEHEVGARTEEWTAHVTKSILGPCVWHVRKRGCRTIPSSEAPEHVRSYLLLSKVNEIEGLTWEQVETLDTKDVLRVTRHQGKLKVTFRLQAPVSKAHTGGLRIGSIVEGSDVEVMPEELMFPFTEAELEWAIENIEGEADLYWRRDNLDPGHPDHPGDY